MMKVILVVGALIILMVIAYFGLTRPTQTVSPTTQLKTAAEQTFNSSPQPFQEMTIPYLRNRQYQSSLGDLAPYSANANFTSYLTSYDSDGLKINALLTKPIGEMPEGGWPAVVFIHGYIPPAQYQTTQKYIEYVNYLARNDLVVLKIDLRGHGDSEGEATGSYYSADYVIDTLNAYAALQSSDFVNPNKIGLWGHSMAGNVTLRTLTAKPTIPAAVIWAGAGYTYTDLQEYRISDQSYVPPANNSQRQQKRQELFATYGQFDPQNDFWKQVVPTNYLNDLKGSIQLNHAADDNVVDIRYSQNLNRLLDDTFVPHEFYEYPTGGHNIDGASFNLAMQRTVNFFKDKLR